jgi:predicted dehydrogenase
MLHAGTDRDTPMNRRHFLTASGAALSLATGKAQSGAGSERGPRLRLGLVGCGGRGSWIARLFAEDGGWQLVGVADYFRERAAGVAQAHGVGEDGVFDGLGGAERLMARGGLDAVALIAPPFFRPGQTRLAVEAGLHCYLAKPVAVDVPGCLAIQAAGEKARAAKRVFLVDFQTRADRYFLEVMGRVRDGVLGEACFGEAAYHAGRLGAQAEPGTAEARLKNWVFDRALSGDIITEQNIHALDMMNWAMNHVNPVSATGTGGRKVRTDVGDCWDHFALVFRYPGNVGVTFSSRQFNAHGARDTISMKLFGSRGVLESEYGGTVMIRGPKDVYHRGGASPGIYEEAVRANIRTFHQSITQGVTDNATLEPSVQSNLITVLGRMAAYGGGTVTWEEMLASRERLDGRLEGLKV